jgi:ACR3 family arsenite transporter
MSIFERYLTIWVALCIVVGIALGQMAPNVFEFAGRIEVAHINLPVAVLVWLMIIPMLIKIDLKQLRGVTQYWRGVGVTLFGSPGSSSVFFFATTFLRNK